MRHLRVGLFLLSSCVVSTGGVDPPAAPDAAPSESDAASTEPRRDAQADSDATPSSGENETFRSCSDGVQNGAETDVDCGGDCAPCTCDGCCQTSSDCKKGESCDDGLCAPGDGTCTTDHACPEGQSCSTAGTCLANSGCRSGPRRGFLDTVAFPTTAACGPDVDYATAVANAPAVCADGWHMCSASEIHVLVGPEPTFEAQGAWVAFNDPTGTGLLQFGAPSCGGVPTQGANLAGTGGCEPDGGYPQGYRLIVHQFLWSASHTTSDPTIPCVQHMGHACGYAGGSSSVSYVATSCCQG